MAHIGGRRVKIMPAPATSQTLLNCVLMFLYWEGKVKLVPEVDYLRDKKLCFEAIKCSLSIKPNKSIFTFCRANCFAILSGINKQK